MGEGESVALELKAARALIGRRRHVGALIEILNPKAEIRRPNPSTGGDCSNCRERSEAGAPADRAKRLECGAFPRFGVARGVRKRGNAPRSKRFATTRSPKVL